MRNEPDQSADTLSDRAAARLEADILGGILPPESRLGIAELAARYGIGATPLREALSRLVARGLVLAIGQRGFRVTPISAADLADIIRIRKVIECEALRLSMQSGDSYWEGEIVAALYRLRRFVEENSSDFSEGNLQFDHLHKDFHTALISACGSPRLIAAHSDLYDQTYRYRRLMMEQRIDPHDFVAAHERLAKMTIERSVPAAGQALGMHIESTLNRVYPSKTETSA